MAQLFHPSTNTLSRVSIFGALFFIAAIIALGAIIVRSPYITEAGVIRNQPVPFSHRHHVADDGIDCRYCHWSVEFAPSAGMPSTSTCMNCHAYLWNDSPALQPVIESYRTGKPIAWTRVHDLPDYAYFDHSIHVAKGIGCTTCHGQVNDMPLMWREAPLSMEWCLECHRAPEKFVRPREAVFRSDWDPPKEQLELGRLLVKEYNIQSKMSCSVCHR